MVTEEIVAGIIAIHRNLLFDSPLRLSVPITARLCTATHRPEVDPCHPLDLEVRHLMEAKVEVTVRYLIR